MISLPVWAWVGGAAVLALGVQEFRIMHIKGNVQECRNEQQAAQIFATQSVLSTEAGWRLGNEGISNWSLTALRQRDTDTALATKSADGLRDRIAQLRRDASNRSCTAPVGKDEREDDPIGVLALVSSGADRLAGVYAKEADERGDIALECEKRYGVVENRGSGQGVLNTKP
jgi:hypothetical protein